MLTEDAKNLTQKEGLSFLEMLTLETFNVEKAFQTILMNIYEIVCRKALAAQQGGSSTGISQGTTINVSNTSKNGSKYSF
ncbi:hypothetical protein PVK06_021409 [Gossypium arboreum]|uniref:Uncharacterized protein n=1 Tax=Gossypium arboreum TaxID=29729 RepID=A0ABR0PPZ1_GOSAR|nr:hypothetical protein PVK06_021409 [Gossypium arboreum]